MELSYCQVYSVHKFHYTSAYKYGCHGYLQLIVGWSDNNSSTSPNWMPKSTLPLHSICHLFHPACGCPQPDKFVGDASQGKKSLFKSPENKDSQNVEVVSHLYMEQPFQNPGLQFSVL